MDLLHLIIFFILGTINGTLFTLIGLRLPENKKIFSKRKCKKCSYELKLVDKIPLLSYIFNRGRCPYCHGKVDILFPYMEFFTGLLFAVSYYSFGFGYELLLAIGMIALLMIVVVSDLTYLIIPDEVLIVVSMYFIIIQLFNLGLNSTILKILGGLFLFIVMYMIMLIGNKVFKKESLGGGDIKMMFVFGLVLDPLLGTLSIFLGSLFALPMSLYLMKRNNEKVIPFGPFLLIAFVFIYFTKITPDGLIALLGLKY